MTVKFIKWTSVVLSSLGIVCCIFIARQPSVYQAFQLIMILALVFLLSILVSGYYTNQLIKHPLGNGARIAITIAGSAIIIALLTYLSIVVLVQQHGQEIQSFTSLGLDKEWRNVLDSRLGSIGIVVAIGSWLMTTFALGGTQKRILRSLIPFTFQLALWIIIYFANTMPPAYNPDTGG